MSFEVRLKELHIELPPPPQPLATYVPAIQAGTFLFLSGVLPMRDGQLAFSGKLGCDLMVEQGMEAARLARLERTGDRQSRNSGRWTELHGS